MRGRIRTFVQNNISDLQSMCSNLTGMCAGVVDLELSMVVSRSNECNCKFTVPEPFNEYLLSFLQLIFVYIITMLYSMKTTDSVCLYSDRT